MSFWSSPVGKILLPCRRSLVLGLWMSFFTAILSAVPILYMISVFDRVMSTRSEVTLVSLFSMVAALYIFWVALEWLRDRLFTRLALRIDWDISPAIFDASFRRQMGRQGVNIHQLMGDMATLRNFVTGAPLLTLLDVPFALIFILIGAVFHPYLAWFALAAVAILSVLAYLNYRITTPILKASNDAKADAARLADENIRHGEPAYAMGMQPALRARWYDRHRESLQLQVNAHEATGMMGSLTEFLQKMLVPAKMGLAAWLAIEGLITAGMVMAASFLIMRAVGPLSSLISNWGQLVAAKQSLDRVNGLMVDWQGQQELMPLPPPSEGLSVEALSVTPPGGRAPLVQDLNFTVAPGEAVAIIGPSASGKTSISKTLLGVWKPSDGSVRLSGVEISEWNHDELGPHVGYVPQQVEFFNATVAENIARLGPVDSEKVVEAAKMAGIHESLLRLPNGYDTLLGERGFPLSGGQRQRVAIARAFYGQPKFIVLDEPNSALDDLGEQILMRAIQLLKSRGSCFVVTTHRPRLVGVVDRIVMINGGKQVAYGNTKDILDTLNQQRLESERQRKERAAAFKVVGGEGTSNG